MAKKDDARYPIPRKAKPGYAGKIAAFNLGHQLEGTPKRGYIGIAKNQGGIPTLPGIEFPVEVTARRPKRKKR